MSTEAAKPPPQANVSIESVLGVQQHNSLATHRRRAIVLGDGRAHHHLRRDELAAAGLVRDAGQLLQHHPQLLVHRHHGARHDGGDRDRRHRPLGRLDHGTDRGRERSHPGGGLSLVGCGGRRPGRGISRRPHQRTHHRLSRAFAVRHHARHAGDRAVGRGGAVGQPDALQVRPGRPCLQDSGRRRSSRSAIPFRSPIRSCS